MPAIPTDAVLGTTIACSFILLGNAITQSFMAIPALLLNFPAPSSATHPDAARQLGRQWRIFFDVGNYFFRPISTLGIAGYAYTSWIVRQSQRDGGRRGMAWKMYALAAACHVVNVVHSAVNMQELNNRLLEMGRPRVDGKDADACARKWARLNMLRMVMPLVAGTVALRERLGH